MQRRQKQEVLSLERGVHSCQEQQLIKGKTRQTRELFLLGSTMSQSNMLLKNYGIVFPHFQQADKNPNSKPNEKASPSQGIQMPLSFQEYLDEEAMENAQDHR